MFPSIADRALRPGELACVLVLLAGCSPHGEQSDGSSGARAGSLTPGQAANAWVAAHPKEWVLAIDDTDPSRAPQRPPWSEPCAQSPESNSVALRYSRDDLEIELFFRCPLDGSSSLDEIGAAFSHLALPRLPHGIVVADWRFQILTPSSSFKEGVSFPAQADGRWGVDVTTTLYAVRGDSLSEACKTPADGRTPPDCYVSIEHRIPLRITLRVPLDPKALDGSAAGPSTSARAKPRSGASSP